jgi:hypothetical protein
MNIDPHRILPVIEFSSDEQARVYNEWFTKTACNKNSALGQGVFFTCKKISTKRTKRTQRKDLSIINFLPIERA